jgi:hypothetical protein
MHKGGFRRWLLLPGALAAAVLLGTACERGPSGQDDTANSPQPTESFTPEQESGTGGAGSAPQDQGAQTAPDEFNRPQQVPPTQPGQGGIGAPGHRTPEEQPTDQGGTRRFEELNGIGNERPTGEERGPRSPPKLDTGEQGGTDAPRP